MKENKQSLNLSSKEAISCVKGLIRYLKDKYRKEGFKIKTYAYKEESIFPSLADFSALQQSIFCFATVKTLGMCLSKLISGA